MPYAYPDNRVVINDVQHFQSGEQNVAPIAAAPINPFMKGVDFFRGVLGLSARYAEVFTEDQLREIDNLVVNLVVRMITGETYIKLEFVLSSSEAEFHIEAINYGARGRFVEVLLIANGRTQKLVIEDVPSA